MWRPEPSKLKSVSPTEMNRLAKCALATAFERDPAFSALKRTNTFALLGTICHRILSGPRPGTRTKFEAVWSEHVAWAYSRLVASCSPFNPPVARQWPFYNQTKIRLRANLLNSASHQSKSGATQESWNETAIGVEQDLCGTPDKIIRFANGTIKVIEYKTGSVLIGGSLKPEIRRQMLLYAYLCNHKFDEWPTELAVYSFHDGWLRVEYTPSHAIDAAADAVRLRDKFNAAVENATTLDLAQPSPHNCLYCHFRTVCIPFQGALSADWAEYCTTIVGRIQRVDQGAYKSVRLFVEKSNMEQNASEATILRIPLQFEFHVGQLVCFDRLKPVSMDGILEMTWNSSCSITSPS
ncbi:MAG TPA: hypothetical protein EYN66_15800 [Myxococcales bacterium]|nr:hypothetical protein [Myxococcales bacterium]